MHASAYDDVQATTSTYQYEHTVNSVFECSLAEKANKLTLIQIEIGDIPVTGLCDPSASHSDMKISFFEKITMKHPFT